MGGPARGFKCCMQTMYVQLISTRSGLLDVFGRYYGVQIFSKM